MPALNAQPRFPLQTPASFERFLDESEAAMTPFAKGGRQGGLSLQGLRLLLGFLTLILVAVGLSGCGGGWGEFKPTITAAVGDQTVKAGETATFTVAATGTGPITYQWYKNGTAVSGATGTKLAMVAQASDTGSKMSVGATNAGGTATSVGTLTVQTPPVITTQPLSQTIAIGGTATFNVAASGTAPLSYQWFANGAVISGANTAAYTTPAVSATGMVAYTVTVSNGVGSATSVPATLTVNSAVPALQFAPIGAQTYGSPSFPINASSASSGAVTYTVVSGPATIAGNTVTLTGVGPVVVSASQAASGTYAAGAATTTFAVNPAVPKLAFAPVPAITAGSAPFAVSASSASSGAVTYTVISGPATVVGNLVTVTGTAPVVLGASQAASSDYIAATATTTFTPAAQTASLAFAPIATQTYGVAPFPVSATSASTGTLTYSVTSGPATLAGNVLTVTGTGTVVLGASQAAAGSYNAATASISFSVNAAVPVLQFSPVAVPVVNGPPFAVIATSASAGAVTYSVISGPATVIGNLVTVTGGGSVTLGASQAASGNYAAATVSTTFTAGIQTPTLTFTPVGSHSYGDAPFPLSAASASSGAVTYTVVSGPASISGNLVTITGAGTVVLSATQAAANGYGVATVNTTFTVSAEVPTLAFTPVAPQVFGSAALNVSATSASTGAITYAVVSGPATVSGSIVTTTGVGMVILSASQAASGSFASAVATTTFNVASAVPTLTFAPIPAHSYGDAPFTVTATSASNGPVIYTVVSGPATITGNTVTLTGNGTVVLGASQASAGNYGLASAQTSVTVGTATPTLSFAPVPGHTYGDAPFTVSATSTSSGPVTYTVVSGPATVAGNTLTITGSGPVVLSASQAASGSYNATTAQTTFTVANATPTLTFTPVPNHTFGDAPFTINATSASAGAITYTVVSGPATVVGNTVTLTGNGQVVLSAIQAASGSYNAGTAQTGFAVGSATPTLSFAPIASHTFGDAAFTVSATSASAGAVTYSITSGPATIVGNTVTVNGTGTVVLAASQAASGNYAAPTPASASFSVLPAKPTLTFAPIPSQIFGEAPFKVTASSASTGTVTYAVVSGPATVVGNMVTITGDGTVLLSASQVADANYTAATTTTFVNVGVATPTLTFTPVANHTFGDAAFTVTASSASAGAITYTVTSGPATIAGNTVTVTGVGTVTLGASQAPAPGYGGGSASASFTVAASSPTLTFAPVANHTFGDAAFTVSATSASPATIVYSVGSGPATIVGNTVTLNGTGTVVLTANQPATGNYGAAAQATTSFTVTAETPTLKFVAVPNHTFGDAAFTVSATSASSGTITYSVTGGNATIIGSTVSITGTGPVTLAASQTAAGNYAAATASTSFTVSAATPTISFNVANQSFGAAAFAVNATSNSTGALTYSVTSGPATIAGNSVSVNGVGTVVLGVSQAATGNYTAATGSATFTVSAVTSTVTFSVANHTYGDTPFQVNAASNSTGTFTYTVTSGQASISGNTVTLNGPGNVTLSATQAAAGNYLGGSASATFTVAAQATALSLSVANHTFGDAPFQVNAATPSSGALAYTVTSGPASVVNNTVTLTGAGTVTLGVSQVAAGNYAAATTSATFTVAPATPVITFTVPNHTSGDPAFTVSASSTEPGTITYTLVSGPATVAGSQITLTGQGTVVLQASQAATTNYNAASTNATFTVAGKAPTIVFSVANHTYGDAPFTVVATSTSAGTFTYAVMSGNATVNGSTVTLTGAGPVQLSATEAAAGNYAGGSASATFTVAAETPTITFVVPNHTFGDPAFAVSATSNSAGTLTYTVVSGPATVVGSTVTLTGAGTVVLEATQAAAGSYGSNSATASFNVAQHVTISPIAPANSTVAPGQVTFNATAQGGYTNTLTWSAGAGSFAAGTSVWTSPNTAGTYTITATSVDDPTKSVSTTITVSKPVITVQPISQSVCKDASFTLSVTASYAATYQWYLGPTLVSGATSSSFFVAAAIPGIAASDYTVVVSNPAGSVVSNVASLTIGTSIVLQPVSVLVKPTQTATFIAGAIGDAPFSYQWYEIPVGGTAGVKIAGATGGTYTSAAVSASDNGEQFYVIIKDACGNPLQSLSATLTVALGNVPPNITLQPVNQTAAVGGVATFSIVATGTPLLSYQWYQIPAGSAVGTSKLITGATLPIYTVPATATNVSDDQDEYFVVVSNGYGQAVSNQATLTVGSGIVITGQPSTVYTLPGQPATYTVAAISALPLTYQWYEAAAGSATFAPIAGATGSTYTQASTAATDTGAVFYVAVSNGTTTTVNSSTASLFVGPLANIPVCSTGWTLAGNAVSMDSTCGHQLTGALQDQHGAIVWPTLLSTGNITLSFTVTTSNTSTPPADGYALVFGDPSLGATLTSTGLSGQGLGAEGIPGLVVAFDDYYNNGDPSVPYLGVGRGEAALWENPYFYTNTNITALATAGATVSNVYTVSLVNGSMTVTMNGAQVFSGPVNAPPVAYIYLTSSTGSRWEQTVVTNLSATVTAP